MPRACARNLEATGGLIVAEAVMMGLAPQLGRGEAHHVVKHACDVALAEAHSAGRGADARQGGGGTARSRGDRAPRRSGPLPRQHRTSSSTAFSRAARAIA